MTREEAIRKLQKQKAEYLEEWVDFSGVAEAYDMAIEALAQPEIIRCKDCKHFMKWRSEESAKKFGQEYECECGRLNVPKPDDFCSRPAPKENR